MALEKIVVLDGKYANPGDLSWEFLRDYGDLTVYDDTAHDDYDQIKDRVKDANIVITNKVPLTAEILESAESLKYVIVSATGYNNIDLDKASDLGIPVSNIPAYSTDSVVQHTLALLLQVTNQVSHYSQAVEEGRWQQDEWTFYDQSHPIVELSGKTLGIIGFGAIGQAFGRVAKQLGMEVLAYNRSENAAGREIASYVSLDQLLDQADVISLHIPLSEDTHHIISAEAISQMKEGVILLNTSRGPLIDEKALADALKSGPVKAAGIDVLTEEPMADDHPLQGLANCFITPHIAWASRESRERLLGIIEDNVAAFTKGEPINLVNP